MKLSETPSGRAITNRKIGIWLLADASPTVIARRARLAEDSGLDFVGVTDGQMIWRDVYVALAVTALQTERVSLGPWVTNPVTRHLTVTANAICTLDELSGGRAFLGIGAGDDSVRTINAEPASLEQLGVKVPMIRALMGRKVVPGEPHEWKLATGRRQAPPVYWAVATTRSLEFAAGMADGVIDTGWLVPSMLSESVALVKAGAEKAGRTTEAVELILNSAVSLGADGDAARQAARTYVARGLMYRRSTDVPGWSEPQRTALRKAYDYYAHLSRKQQAVDLVPEELITTKAIAGTAAEAVRQIRMVFEAGYTGVALTPLGDVEETISLLGTQVLPEVREQLSAHLSSG